MTTRKRGKEPAFVRFQLSICRCPVHTKYWSVSLDENDESGGGSGTRLTPSKCCGQWEVVTQWHMESYGLQIIRDEAQRMLDALGEGMKSDHL